MSSSSLTRDERFARNDAALKGAIMDTLGRAYVNSYDQLSRFDPTGGLGESLHNAAKAELTRLATDLHTQALGGNRDAINWVVTFTNPDPNARMTMLRPDFYSVIVGSQPDAPYRILHGVRTLTPNALNPSGRPLNATISTATTAKQNLETAIRNKTYGQLGRRFLDELYGASSLNTGPAGKAGWTMYTARQLAESVQRQMSYSDFNMFAQQSVEQLRSLTLSNSTLDSTITLSGLCHPLNNSPISATINLLPETAFARLYE